jgi:hypothetical protein
MTGDICDPDCVVRNRIVAGMRANQRITADGNSALPGLNLRFDCGADRRRRREAGSEGFGAITDVESSDASADPLTQTLDGLERAFGGSTVTVEQVDPNLKWVHAYAQENSRVGSELAFSSFVTLERWSTVAWHADIAESIAEFQSDGRHIAFSATVSGDVVTLTALVRERAKEDAIFQFDAVETWIGQTGATSASVAFICGADGMLRFYSSTSNELTSFDLHTLQTPTDRVCGGGVKPGSAVSQLTMATSPPNHDGTLVVPRSVSGHRFDAVMRGVARDDGLSETALYGEAATVSLGAYCYVLLNGLRFIFDRTAIDPALIGVHLRSGGNIVSAAVFSALGTWARSGGMFIGNSLNVVAVEMDVLHSAAVRAAFVADADESLWYADRVTITDGSRTATLEARVEYLEDYYATYVPVGMTVTPPAIIVRSAMVEPAPVVHTTLPSKAPPVSGSVAAYHSPPAADVHTQESAAPDDDDKLATGVIVVITIVSVAMASVLLVVGVRSYRECKKRQRGYTLLF